jgi:hypothetical protein
MASGPTRQTLVLAVVLTALLALLVGAGGAWLARTAEIDDLKARLATAERRLAEIAEAEAALEPEAEGETSAGETPATNDDDGAAATSPGSAGPTERVPAIVTDARTSGSTHYVTLDYIQFLTGDEAAAAATAAGEESPPPNDYFIVNANPRLREYPVESGVVVSVVSNPDGTSVPEGRDMTLADWVTALGGTSADYYKMNFYWVDIVEGTVTGLEQQYLP